MAEGRSTHGGTWDTCCWRFFHRASDDLGECPCAGVGVAEKSRWKKLLAVGCSDGGCDSFSTLRRM